MVAILYQFQLIFIGSLRLFSKRSSIVVDCTVIVPISSANTAEDRYVDVKNDYHYSISKDKFKAIRKCNPNIKLDILLKEDLNRLGIEV